MNKTYNLIDEKKKKDRVIDSAKHDIRKYIKREKNKPLAEGVDFWKMECKLSKDEEKLKAIEFTALIKTFDELVAQGANSINVEIVSTKGISKKEKPAETKENSESI